ncbi:MAG TPA: tetratricopeptide repeat protein, partial [Sphingomicrobium sp.]|nr:tetratricopeptide repeat protein [Sphingomicrobium sp.]
RNYAESVASARRALQVAPDRVNLRRILGNSLLMMGKVKDAESEYRQLEPSDYRRLVGEAVLAARAGDRDSAIAGLLALQQRYGDLMHYQYGQIYAQLGEVDQAFKELRSALEKRDVGLAVIRVDPFLDPIRRDPRFAAIEAKLNFPI